MNRASASAPTNDEWAFAQRVERIVLALSRWWLPGLIMYGMTLTLLPVIAPMLKSSGQTALASPIYFAYQFICHQRADRSLHVHGEQMAYCARDLAIFAGAVGVALAYASIRRFYHPSMSGLLLVVLAVIPIGLDGVTQLAGWRESTTALRIVTGVAFSAGVGWYLLPRLEAGFRALEVDVASRTLPATTPAMRSSGSTEV
ncbi:MAG TPA: DUF2085 domain-containing protein [Thermomicrobiales bacterium]|nr:DUF2085 domain-containing protein [Thermomicrobiales bacterium]